ncbi:Arg-Lys translocation region protein phosphatase RktP [Leptospira borgpetersenii]|uniref:Arg-Lys translocation region protein phosphatase RktP n=1 Tax=Leptospira borgpetersenii TaxID=174 RepID=UPI000773472E|nr:Arg-Lys translocation region protein phosphatase RktP [Leptospira borgpetersenii]MBE8400829.1 Arg-Lys translocation region protein phosphatase [Leptospira borgpetersenii serovar Tarassovi]MBE8404132.1 Arg-Lys translocation region protein phosphatase [Leptospira borgpetersenii serovar Tarassovi]MBE8406650.1 Arg-Lys translocation region protein phosphatase [Leptospira borgpetersenii serovar Tarassovi]MBE8411281.1 Arg-Lys translocation region protein phosphatase [Leptospira borgpetersenii serov
MVTKIPSKLKLSIAVFVLSFLFFLIYTVTDDLILKSPLGQQKAIALSIRLAISVSFSTLLASFVFYSVKLIYSSMRSLVTLVQDWGNDDVYEETPVAERNDEIGELVRAFRLKFFQQKELEDAPSQEALGERTKELSDSIQRAFYRIHLPKIQNLDVSLLPRMSGNSNCDYVNVIPSMDGCVGVLAGFPSFGVLESAFKARLEGIFSLANEAGGIRGEELIFKIGKILSKMPVPFLNLSLFYLITKTGELGFIHFQELPAFVYKNGELNSLEKTKARYFNYKAIDLDVKKTILKMGEYWILVSDRTYSTIGVSGSEFTKQLQDTLEGKNLQNSRDLVLNCGRILEQKFGKQILETSALLAVARKQ